MSWVKTIIIPFSEFEKGAYHSEETLDCSRLQETDEGCPTCDEEKEYVEELAIKMAERGKYEFVDIMMTNRPGRASDEDRFWEFEVELKQPTLGGRDGY